MKISLFLVLIFSIFCVKAHSPELLNPEVFFYICSEKYSGKVDNPHFFGLLDALNSAFQLDEKPIFGEKDFKKKYKKHILEKLSENFFIENTVLGKEILELFLQVLSDCPAAIKHDQNCQLCKKNGKFIVENRLAVANLIKFISLKKNVEKNNLLKWIGFLGTLIAIVAGFLINENFFAKKSVDLDLVQQNENLKKELKEKNNENEELREENRLTRAEIKEIKDQIGVLVGDFGRFSSQTNFRLEASNKELEKLNKQLEEIKKPDS